MLSRGFNGVLSSGWRVAKRCWSFFGEVVVFSGMRERFLYRLGATRSGVALGSMGRLYNFLPKLGFLICQFSSSFAW